MTSPLPTHLRLRLDAFKRRLSVKGIAIAVMMCSVQGCGTFMRNGLAGVQATAPFYPATCFDVNNIANVCGPNDRKVSFDGFMAGFICVVDLPVSIIFDTLLLPWDLRDYRRQNGSWEGEQIAGAGVVCRDPETGGSIFWFDEYQYPRQFGLHDLPDGKAGTLRHKEKGHLEAVLHWSEKDHYFIRWSEAKWTPSTPPPKAMKKDRD